MVARHPWRRLKHLDLNGRLSCRVLQVIAKMTISGSTLINFQVVVAHAEALESLAVTNWPNEMVSGGMAFDDSWLPAIIDANPLPNIRFCRYLDGFYVFADICLHFTLSSCSS